MSCTRSCSRSSPRRRLWFTDGTNEAGKVVANPNVGYGGYTITYADGSTREFYRIGLSANTAGISVYVLGLDDKTFLKRTYGDSIGKASVTGYCIRFKRLADIDVDVLQSAIRHGMTLDQTRLRADSAPSSRQPRGTLASAQHRHVGRPPVRLRRTSRTRRTAALSSPRPGEKMRLGLLGGDMGGHTGEEAVEDLAIGVDGVSPFAPGVVEHQGSRRRSPPRLRIGHDLTMPDGCGDGA